jgi:adenylate kinase
MAVVRANYCKKGVNERKIAKANIYYIQNRPGRDKERLTRTLFGPSGTMGRHEGYQFVTEAPKGTYFYRLRLSPDPKREDVKRDLNMHKLTRHMMKRLEKRLTTTLCWAAAVHDDHTDIRHVHILAAIPKHLQTYELEFLIREATANSLVQRRILDRGVTRLPWQEDAPSRHLKMGKYTAHRYQEKSQSQAKGVSLPQSVCSCPRCHMPHAHNGQRGSHQCRACGLMLHQKKERTLIRQRDKGRGLERSL